jgi:hypothetical protein
LPRAHLGEQVAGTLVTVWRPSPCEATVGFLMIGVLYCARDAQYP